MQIATLLLVHWLQGYSQQLQESGGGFCVGRQSTLRIMCSAPRGNESTLTACSLGKTSGAVSGTTRQKRSWHFNNDSRKR
jgi:hypothetical protein